MISAIDMTDIAFSVGQCICRVIISQAKITVMHAIELQFLLSIEVQLCILLVQLYAHLL